jgi:hypothetical protein
VSELRFRRFHDRPDQLVVLGGPFGTRRTLVAVEDVLEVHPRELRLHVRVPEETHERPSFVGELLARIRHRVRAGRSRTADA